MRHIGLRFRITENCAASVNNMFNTAHAAIGVAATSVFGINEPAMAFTVGWLLHYVADAVPHGDERLGSWAMRHKHPTRIMALIFAADFLVASLSIAVIGLVNGFSWPMLFAAAGSMVPDFLLGMEMVFGLRTLSWLTRFHILFHKFTGFIYSLKYGLLLQLIVAATAWHYALRALTSIA